jgi:hypothetical protein
MKVRMPKAGIWNLESGIWRKSLCALPITPSPSSKAAWGICGSWYRKHAPSIPGGRLPPIPPIRWKNLVHSTFSLVSLEYRNLVDQQSDIGLLVINSIEGSLLE